MQTNEDFSNTKKKNNISLKTILHGDFLAKEVVVKQLPFFFFLTLMAILYISNTYYAEKKLRQIDQLSKEIKELHAEFIYTKSELMFHSKQSEIAKVVEAIGLKESVVPPKKIVVKPEQ